MSGFAVIDGAFIVAAMVVDELDRFGHQAHEELLFCLRKPGADAAIDDDAIPFFELVLAQLGNAPINGNGHILRIFVLFAVFIVVVGIVRDCEVHNNLTVAGCAALRVTSETAINLKRVHDITFED